MKRFGNWFKFLLLLLSGALLCYLSFKQLNARALWNLLLSGNYAMIVPVYLISLTGYWFRTKRWQLMLGSMNHPVQVAPLYASLCTGYLVNYVFPRLGELTRCALVKKSNQVPFDHTLITIVAERTIDTICLFVLLVPAFALYHTLTFTFFDEHVISPLFAALVWWKLLIALLALTIMGLVLYYLLKTKSKDRFYIRKLAEWKDGIKAIMNLPQRAMFGVYTILIWSCYFLMTYLWMFTFQESSAISIGQAFVVMVIGSIGRSVPIQGGGMGAYHFLVSQTLHMFGLSLVTGNALALIIHGAQSLLTFISGSVAYLWLLILFNKSKTPIN